jgi:catechol 2,3-dioxygenase-like lactoylglutathione lyase family enzyme
MKILELNHVAIHVSDVEKSIRFYHEVLRLESIPRPAFTFPGAWFRLGANQELHIIGDRAEPVYSHNRGNHFALLVDDLDSWEGHLDSLGAKHLPRKRRPDGAWQLFLRDPDEHVIELFTPPPRSAAKD